ncbi:hypothetical protein C0Q70_15799 [Pomacea canaliculata]|uniref:Uncharacterized protein n=1 Tax=Pomacea canaliculata TaxID=400727 RepID=A0A2T7NVV6_POMCA|nr:uncharacterized protein LOC112572992 [Pomacea canaliculata]PVD25299.1 hypothetical protein C0Q70_15799 [Pomacea canaliculata]
MTTRAKLAFFHLLTSLPAFYTMSLDANVTAGQAVSSSLEPSVGGLEMRKLRHIEAELEVLRRTVTELKAGGQCGSQSPHGDLLKELMSEIQGLRSQFQALQMRRELSALRSDMLQAKSLLADAGSRLDDLPGEDASKQGSDLAGRTVEAGVVQNIPSILSSGIIGGSSHDQTGAAANALCLPLEPVLVNNPGTPHVTLILGAELEVTPLAQHDLDPLCAVCRTSRPTVVMVPAANACQLGWTLEYSGYLMAGHNTHPGATQFICIDKEQQTRMASDKNENGRLFYYSTGSCGSLPCPPYQAGKVFPCVVCSK